MNNLNPEPSNASNHDRSSTEMDEIQVDELAEHDMLSITTANNTYEIVVVHPKTAQVMVRGGRYFPSDTPAHLYGSSVNSSIKLHGIYVGYPIEFFAGNKRIKTSVVRSIRMLGQSELAA